MKLPDTPKTKKFIDDFKAFAMKGNVIDMAVGIIIGAAFGKIVSSLVGDVVMPLVGILIGGVDFSSLSVTLSQAVTDASGEILKPAVVLTYGKFIQATVDFLIIAFALFLLIKGISKLKRKEVAAPAPPPAPAEPSDEVKLLSEIRDLMKNGQK